eukprot:COSAG06_NODE_147_length_22091_cov_70.669880_17_plen_115_part_00
MCAGTVSDTTRLSPLRSRSNPPASGTDARWLRSCSRPRRGRARACCGLRSNLLIFGAIVKVLQLATSSVRMRVFDELGTRYVRISTRHWPRAGAPARQPACRLSPDSARVARAG